MSDTHDCLFCKIAEGQLPSTKVYETAKVLGFKDAHPQAPTHVLFIPKKHIEGVERIAESDDSTVTDLVIAANQTAKDMGINQRGYRLVINCKRDGGQTVDHLHLHLLGGRPMHWPPG